MTRSPIPETLLNGGRFEMPSTKTLACFAAPARTLIPITLAPPKVGDGARSGNGKGNYIGKVSEGRALTCIDNAEA